MRKVSGLSWLVRVCGAVTRGKMRLRRRVAASAALAGASLALVVALAAVLPQSAPARPARGQGARVSHTITYDKYSLMIDGKRTFIWSGEFEYWRLPSPSLWLDILQKMKAEGYNAVTIYFDWAYHSPKSGVYDFSGVRDVDKLLDMAAQVGLYVIARPGPYINAETSAGGLPGWLTTKPVRRGPTRPTTRPQPTTG